MKNKCYFCFKTISIKPRFKIFNYLKEKGERITVSQIVNFIKLTQPTVTFHINQLEAVGLIKKERRGRLVFCSVNKSCSDCPLFSY